AVPRCLPPLPTRRSSDLAAAGPAPASQPSPRPQAPKRPPSVMEVQEERSDPELLELFIEEAKEEIASIQRYLPIWAERPEDSDALISVRRSFHTLKGSGRMVGAQLIGEFAWSIENLLNRVINQTLEATPAMVEFIGEAASVFPQLIEQLEVGIAPRADVQLLMKRAEAFAAGDPDISAQTGESPDAARSNEPEGEPEPSTSDTARMEAAASPQAEAPAAGAAMDPVLSEIFVKETLGHLETLRAFVESASRGEPPYFVDEPVYRACHTLLGSAKMAAFAPAVALARPLSEHLGRLFQSGRGLDGEGIRTLAAAAGEIRRMTQSLAAGSPFTPDGDVVARLERLGESAVEPPQPKSTESLSTDDAFDPEIAAIFTEEAAEILENAEVALDALRRDGSATSSVVELQRLVHTLKGGARMAGISAMGDLSHALVTLLAGMAEKRFEPTGAALDLVQQCFDELHRMRDRIDAGHRVASAGEL